MGPSILAFVATLAHASVDPACVEVANAGPPADYDEQSQQDFLQNYYALSSTLSPIHGPVPHEPGRGAVGLEIAALPPLPCERRLVLGYTKTEDTNKAPAIPRPRVTVALPALFDDRLVPYIGFAYVPPVTVAGVRNVIVSGEAGLGLRLGSWQVGARFHATSHKTVGEVAPPFDPEDPAVDDLYLASTVGVDLLGGLSVGPLTPYVAVGLTDASTFFYIGDDGVVSNNLHPYFGVVGSAGVDALLAGRIRLGAELYAAPGGVSRPDPSADTLRPVSRYGNLLTVRVRAAVEL